MNVLLLTKRLDAVPGGIERSLYHISRTLQDLGHEPVIMSSSISSGLAPGREGRAIRVEACSRKRWWLPVEAVPLTVGLVRKHLRRVCREFKPDLICARHVELAWAAVSSRTGAPVVYIAPTALSLAHWPSWADLWRWHRGHVQGILATVRSRLLLPRNRRCERRVLGSDVPVVAFSDNIRRGLMNGAPRRRPNIHVIRPGVDGEFFRPVARDSLVELAGRLGLRSDDRVAIYVGRLDMDKNVTLLLDAFRLVDCPHKKLVVVGSGAGAARLRARARTPQLAGRVIFAGARFDDLNRYYCLARVNVLPTAIEGFGLSHVEAMACGVPSIGFSGRIDGAHTATEEIIEDGATGFVVGELSAAALAAAVQKALRLAEPEWQAMSQRAAGQSRARFRWDRFVEGLLALAH